MMMILKPRFLYDHYACFFFVLYVSQIQKEADIYWSGFKSLIIILKFQYKVSICFDIFINISIQVWETSLHEGNNTRHASSEELVASIKECQYYAMLQNKLATGFVVQCAVTMVSKC